MIDTITLVGTLKDLDFGDLKRLEQVAFLRESGTKFRPFKDYLESPITRAQIQCKLLQRPTARRNLLEVWLKIPVASALIGQNYMHGGPECFVSERGLLAKLIRVVLESRGFSEGEVDRFFETTRTESVELTWHTETASARAASNLQNRTLEFLQRMESLSRFRDCYVSDVDIRIKHQRRGHLTTLKDGRQFRQYLKAEQMAVVKRREWKVSAANADSRPDRAEIRALLMFHLRSEVILGEQYLRKRGHLNPATWTPEILVNFIEDTFSAMRFSGPPMQTDLTLLDEGLRGVLERRMRGDDLSDLPRHTYTRLRQRLQAYGYEIALAGKNLAYTAAVGRQLDFSRRWIVPPQYRRFIVCEETYDSIERRLDHGLASARAYFTPELRRQLEAERFSSNWLITRRPGLDGSPARSANGSIGSSPA